MLKRLTSSWEWCKIAIQKLRVKKSSHSNGNTYVVRRIFCIFFGHIKLNNKCQRCYEQFGVPKMDYPPEPP